MIMRGGIFGIIFVGIIQNNSRCWGEDGVEEFQNRISGVKRNVNKLINIINGNSKKRSCLELKVDEITKEQYEIQNI